MEKEKLLEMCELMNEEQAAAICTFIEIFQKKEGESQEKQEKVVKPEPKPEPQKVSRYEANATMKMMGQQYPASYIEKEGVHKAIEEIVDAYGLTWFHYDSFELFSFVLDIFLYGVIEGKRELRQRKRASAHTKTQAETL